MNLVSLDLTTSDRWHEQQKQHNPPCVLRDSKPGPPVQKSASLSTLSERHPLSDLQTRNSVGMFLSGSRDWLRKEFAKIDPKRARKVFSAIIDKYSQNGSKERKTTREAKDVVLDHALYLWFVAHAVYWLATLTSVPLGLVLNPEEDMDIWECIVPSWHVCTLNSRRVESPFVMLVEREERWEAPDQPQGVIPLNWGETELNRSVTCMVLITTANDMQQLALSPDEFRGP
ncbi:uncharacterized protein TNCV_4503121 [Trichonephila clavipes]|nr:uncharacterized protein TNCV_4503121 [Trichonephila clavipes]